MSDEAFNYSLMLSDCHAVTFVVMKWVFLVSILIILILIIVLMKMILILLLLLDFWLGTANFKNAKHLKKMKN